jgi:hypothetical protein
MCLNLAGKAISNLFSLSHRFILSGTVRRGETRRKLLEPDELRRALNLMTATRLGKYTIDASAIDRIPGRRPTQKKNQQT